MLPACTCSFVAMLPCFPLVLPLLLPSCHVSCFTSFCCQVEEKGGFTEAGLKKQITVDMSAPVVGGIKGWILITLTFFSFPFHNF